MVRMLRMPTRRCPFCGQPGRLLEELSKDANVYYYVCDTCANVWCYDKADLNAPAIAVTRKKHPA